MKNVTSLLEEVCCSIANLDRESRSLFLESVIHRVSLHQWQEITTKKPLEINCRASSIPTVILPPGTKIMIHERLKSKSSVPVDAVNNYFQKIDSPLTTNFSIHIQEGKFSGKEGVANAAFIFDSCFPELWEELVTETGRADLVAPLGQSKAVVVPGLANSDDVDSWYKMEMSKIETEYGDQPEEKSRRMAILKDEYRKKKEIKEAFFGEDYPNLTEEMEASAEELLGPLARAIPGIINTTKFREIIENPVRFQQAMSTVSLMLQKIPDRADEGFLSSTFKVLSYPFKIAAKTIVWVWIKILIYFFEPRRDTWYSAKTRWKAMVVKRKPGVVDATYETIKVAGILFDYSKFRQLYFSVVTTAVLFITVGTGSYFAAPVLKALYNWCGNTMLAAEKAIGEIIDPLSNPTVHNIDIYNSFWRTTQTGAQMGAEMGSQG